MSAVHAESQYPIDARGDAAVHLTLNRLSDALDDGDLSHARALLSEVRGLLEPLSRAESTADALLLGSWVDAAELGNRARASYRRTEAAGLDATRAAERVRGAGEITDASAAFDACRAAAEAEDDFTDVQVRMTSTVLGVAKARAVMLEMEKMVQAQSDDLAPARLERASLALLEAEGRSTDGFEAARGSLSLDHPDYHLWAGVVAVGVQAPTPEGALLRVAMINPRTNTMVGRVTLPAEAVRDAGGRLHLPSVVGQVARMASADHPVGSVGESRSAACRRLLAELARTIPPF